MKECLAEITINRALETYRRKGYSDDWINQRLKAIDARKEFTDELKNNGIESSKDFAILTDLLTKVWSGYTTMEYKQYKGLMINHENGKARSTYFTIKDKDIL